MKRYEDWGKVDEVAVRYANSTPEEREKIGRELFPRIYGYLHNITYQILRGDGWTLKIGSKSIFLRFFREDIEVEDLVMECYPYLIERMKKYDPSRSSASTFISIAAGTFMNRYLGRNNGIIRIPPSVRRTSIKLKSKGISVNGSLEELMVRHRLTPYQALFAANLGPTESLDSPLPRKGNTDPSEQSFSSYFLRNPPETLDPLGGLVESECNARIRRSLICLTPREKRFVELRYGLNGVKKCLTLEEIGNLEKPSLTRERVRQIIINSLGKVKHHLGSTGINSVVDLLD